jgi:hypothetical protein
VYSKSHRTCCAEDCNTSERGVQGWKTFVNLSNAPNRLTEYCSFERRRTHAIKTTKRKEWFKRLQVPQNRNRAKGLVVCSLNHSFEKNLLPIVFKSEDGTEVMEALWIKVPSFCDAEPPKTRTAYKQRRPLSEKDLSKHRAPMVPQKQRMDPSDLQKQWTRKCVHLKCNNKDKFPGLSWHRIPKAPKTVIDEHSRSDDRQRFAILNYLRDETIRRLGLSSENNAHAQSRFCSDHPMEEVIKSVRWIDAKNKERSTLVQLVVPHTSGK